MKIHATIALIVIVLGIILKLESWEWIVCISWFVIVIGGTFIEIVVNLAMPRINEDAKRSKDIAAEGV